MSTSDDLQVQPPHVAKYHQHGCKVLAISLWSSVKRGQVTREHKLGLWCPVCGLELTAEGKRYRDRVLGTVVAWQQQQTKDRHNASRRAKTKRINKRGNKAGKVGKDTSREA